MQQITNRHTSSGLISKRRLAPELKEVAVIGAGPYGLSAAAYLRQAGLQPYVVGQTMSFWKQNMPKNMFLRSKAEACNISAPHGHLTMESYRRALGREFPVPLPIEDFIGYGEWFQKQVAPDLDSRRVTNLSLIDGAFQITFDDGDAVRARSVVLAIGIGSFQHRPEAFTATPRSLAPHVSEVHDLSSFRGKRVAVIGKGQSALEGAALLSENGAHAEIICRAPLQFREYPWMKYLWRRLTPGPLRPLSHWVLPPTDLGGFRTGRVVAHPQKFRRLTRERQDALIKDVCTPIGAYWLVDRLKSVPAKTGVTVTSVARAGDGLKLLLSDGSSDCFDRVLLATGYKIDISKYDILDRSLKEQIQVTPDGYPALSLSLETSVKGLFLAGATAEKTLGPTLRFVTGTANAGPALAAAFSRKASNR